MTWLARLQAWLFGAPPKPAPPEPSVVHVLERSVVVTVFYAAGVRFAERSLVDAIAIAARRYALAIQRHDDELLDAREASAVEERLRGVLHEAVRAVPGLPKEMVPVVGREIVVRFSGLEVSP